MFHKPFDGEAPAEITYRVAEPNATPYGGVFTAPVTSPSEWPTVQHGGKAREGETLNEYEQQLSWVVGQILDSDQIRSNVIAWHEGLRDNRDGTLHVLRTMITHDFAGEFRQLFQKYVKQYRDQYAELKPTDPAFTPQPLNEAAYVTAMITDAVLLAVEQGIAERALRQRKAQRMAEQARARQAEVDEVARQAQKEQNRLLRLQTRSGRMWTTAETHGKPAISEMMQRAIRGVAKI